MVKIPFDIDTYLRPPRLTLAGSVTLAEALLAKDTTGDSESVRSAHTKLNIAAQEAQEALRKRERHQADRELYIGSNETTRSIDEAADNAWRALYEGLTAIARLPEQRYPQTVTAQRLLTLIFPNGNINFLRMRYVDQYTLMKAKVLRIEEDGHLPDLLNIIGPLFWQEIVYTLEKYRAMVHGGLDGAVNNSDLMSTYRNLQTRITDFASKVAGQIDIDDEEAIAEAKRRLAPIPTAKTVVRRARQSESDSPNAPPTEPQEDSELPSNQDLDVQLLKQALETSEA